MRTAGYPQQHATHSPWQLQPSLLGHLCHPCALRPSSLLSVYISHRLCFCASVPLFKVFFSVPVSLWRGVGMMFAYPGVVRPKCPSRPAPQTLLCSPEGCRGDRPSGGQGGLSLGLPSGWERSRPAYTCILGSVDFMRNVLILLSFSDPRSH